MSMSDQLPMFDHPTSPDTPSATSSQESESGRTRSVSPAGRTKKKSGPDRVPVNPSAWPVKAKRSTMKGIFGQSGFHSSKHEDLSFALASKLRPLTDSLGSTLFNLTWTVRITPAGRSICALRASEPLTEGSVFIGWPTPRSTEAGHSTGNPDRAQNGKARLEDTVFLCGWPTTSATDGLRGGEQTKEMSGSSLQQWAKMAGWPTTRAEDAESSGMRHKRGISDTMTAVAALAGWGSPETRDWKSGDASQETMDRNARPLNEQVRLAGWATPKVKTGDYQYNHGDHSSISLNLSGEAQLTAFGETPIGFLLGPNGWEIVPASGQLNAAHSRWLMGLPHEWDECAQRAFKWTRKARTTKSCAFCGKSLSRLSDVYRRKYCNKECMAKAYTKKPTTKADGRWQAQHLFPNRKCERCGIEKEELHRHHRDSDPTNNMPENIQILCRACHNAVHREIAILADDLGRYSP
jgi:hypothetical protein